MNDLPRKDRRYKGVLGPVVLLFVGFVFLLEKT
jgi:hypothetical protein